MERVQNFKHGILQINKDLKLIISAYYRGSQAFDVTDPQRKVDYLFQIDNALYLKILSYINIYIQQNLNSNTQPMLETKESMFSTLQTHKTMQIFSSRMHQIRYNINDYLPNDCEYKPPQILPIFRREQFEIYSAKSRVQEGESQYEAGYKELIANLQETIREKDTQIQKITQQLKQQQKDYEQKINKANKELADVMEKVRKIEIENNAYTTKIKQIQEILKQQQKQKERINEQLTQMKKQQQKKLRNIRIFCQKYQIVIEPKKKQFYTIEVQTEKQQVTITKQVFNFQEVGLPNSNKFNNNEGLSNRKISCHGKPQFYQLYQQHQQAQYNDLNNQFTTRSQVISSGYKPKKPSFMEQNVSQFTDKENDRKRINQRIDGKSWIDNKSKQKIKVKNEEIQIYPIDDTYIEDIVKGILATK